MADAPHPSPKGGTFDILGHKVKKNTAYVAGAAGVGVIIIAVMRKRAAAQAAAAVTTAALVSDPAGNQCASLNPATGYCPGTQADIAAQQSTAAGLSSAAITGGGGGGGGYYVPPALGTGGVSGTGSAVPSFVDNASWGQYVETALGSNGSDSVAAAIAKYLSGQPVTADQQTLIEEAIAIAGYPPVGGATGSPPSMTLLSPAASSGTTTPVTTGTGTTTTTTGTTATGTTTTTGTGSTTATKPAAAPTVSGGKMTLSNNNDVTVEWTGTGASEWEVTLSFSGPENGRSGKVTVPKASYSGLPSGHTGYVTVQPLIGGEAAGKPGKIDIATTK